MLYPVADLQTGFLIPLLVKWIWKLIKTTVPNCRLT